MRVTTGVVGALLLAMMVGPLASPADDSFKSLADAHQWFTLRRAIGSGAVPPFYRGLAAAAFNDIPAAEKYLRAAIAAGLDRDSAYAAHQALAELYFRNGHYPKGVVEANQTFLLRPPSDSEKQLIGEMEKLPEMTVASRRPSSTTYSTWDDVMILMPSKVNGISASFILDTDSNISVICDSEAKRLGLTVGRGSLDVGGINEAASPGGRFTVAKTLKIGATELRNVPFVVVRNDQYPFVELPEGSRGVFGLPVLLALQTIRWRRDKRLEIAFPSRGPLQGAAPLAFDGGDPLAEVEIEGHRVPVVFDTGNEQSVGWVKLGLDFPDLLKGAEKGTEDVKGYSGVGSFESAMVPSLHWKIGAFPAILQDVPVYTKSTPSKSRYYASLGADLLRQSSEVTIDFQALQLQLRRAR